MGLIGICGANWKVKFIGLLERLYSYLEICTHTIGYYSIFLVSNKLKFRLYPATPHTPHVSRLFHYPGIIWIVNYVWAKLFLWSTNMHLNAVSDPA